MTQSTPETEPTLLSTTPRALTPEINRRLWRDPIVRFWWLAGMTLLALGLYVLLSQLNAWRKEAWLVRNGTRVDATIRVADGEQIPGRRKRPDAYLELEYAFNGRKWQVAGVLSGRRAGDFVAVGDVVPVHIDPGSPESWTARTESPPIGAALVGGLLASLLCVPAFAASWWVRRSLVRIWVDGRLIDVNVLGRQQTALAPRSQAIRCAPQSGGGRVAMVYVPSSSPESQSPTVRVLLPRSINSRGRPLAVAWME